MTELLVICAVSVMGIAFAVNVARWLLARPVGHAQLVSTSQLVSAGAQRYLRRHNVVALSVAAVFAAAVLLTFGISYQSRGLEDLAPRQHGILSTAAYLLGALATSLCAWIGAWTARHASVRVAAGARRSLDEALQVALRAGAVAGVVSQAVSVLAVAACSFLLLGYFAAMRGEPFVAVGQVALLPVRMAGLALGAGFVALLAQIGGGIFACVASAGAGGAGEIDRGSCDDPAHNPATVADLVGDQVGEGAARAATGLCAAITESLAAMMVAALLFRDNPVLPSVTAVVLFPLVLRAFGLMSGWFGVLVVRTDDTEVPMNALVRGFYVSALLYSVAAIGSAKWLLGEHWLRLGGATLIGMVASVLYLFAVQYCSEQRYRPVKTLAETARTGPTLAALRGLLVAADGAILLIAVTMIATMAAYHVGAGTGLVGGGMFGIALAMAGLCGAMPYLLAIDSMGTVADSAAGILEMTVGSERPDVRARTQLLGAVGTTGKSLTRVVSTVATSLACFLLMAIFVDRVAEARGIHLRGFEAPMIYLGALLGLLIVIAFGRTLLGRIVAAARDRTHELRHRRAAGEVDPPSEARADPSVEAVSRAALRGMLPPAIVGVGAPLLIGASLRLLTTRDNATAPAEALVALVVVATVAAGLASLLFTNAASAWDNAKRYIETGAHGGRYLRSAAAAAPPADDDEAAVHEVNPTYLAAVIGDTIGDPLRSAVAPATQALVATLASLLLVFLPFFL